jgi:hypothetical protein
VYEKKTEEKEDESKPKPPKKPRLDLTKNRPAWCMGCVAEAVRSDGPSSSSRWTAPRGRVSNSNSGGRGRGDYGSGRATASLTEAAASPTEATGGQKEAALTEGEAWQALLSL